MVDKIKVLLGRLKDVLDGLTPSQRLTFGLGAVLILGSMAAMLTFATRSSYEYLADVSQLSAEERKDLESLLQEEGISWELEGNVMSVEEGRRKNIVMKLNLEKKMPSNRQAFKWLFEQTPLNTPTPRAMEQKLRLSRALELEQTITSLEWVQGSKVIITEGNDLDPLKPRRHPTKATISIQTRQRQSLDREDIDAVRALVSYAIPKLKERNVGIVIDGKPYIFKEKSKFIQESDEWMKRQVAIEEYHENRLRAFFLGVNGQSALVKRMQISVSVELDREVIKEHVKRTREDSNLVRMTDHKHTTTGKGPGIQETGVFDETSVEENTFTGTEAQAFKDEESNKTEEYLPAIDETISVSKIPGAVKKISAVLVFDVNDMIMPSPLDIKNKVPEEEILSRKTNDFQKAAAKSLGLEAALIDNIAVQTMQFALEDLPEPIKVGDVILGVLEKSGGQFLVFGLSLFGFLYFVNMLRQAFETPEMEEEMDEDEIKRRTSEEDVARMLDAQEQDVTDVRARQIEARVIKMVKDDPESAASLIKRWLVEDEGSGQD
jgi:flagellar M-ring protein FliF